MKIVDIDSKEKGFTPKEMMDKFGYKQSELSK